MADICYVDTDLKQSVLLNMKPQRDKYISTTDFVSLLLVHTNLYVSILQFPAMKSIIDIRTARRVHATHTEVSEIYSDFHVL